MTEPLTRPPIMYAVAAWMALNIFLMITLILSGDWADPNNYLEIVLWIASIPALLSLRKWGVAFATSTLIYTLSTSVGILIYFYTTSPDVWPNALRVVINAVAAIYLFNRIFRGKYK
jgi:hypothetical protein